MTTNEVYIDEESLEALMAQAQSGDKIAYGVLLERLMPFVRGCIFYKIKGDEDREEVMQMIFLRIHQYLHTFADNGTVKAWVGVVMRNVVIDFYKLNRKKDFLVEVEEWNDENVGGDYYDSPENQASLNELMSSVPDSVLEPIVKNKIYGRSFEELAAEDNSNVNAYKVKLHRAVKKLKKHFEL